MRRPLLRPTLAVIAVALCVLVIGVPLALAIHDFTEVPDANPFHADIAAMKRAA